MSFVESFANNYTTTLSGAITSGATSLVVHSAAGAPLSPQFRLAIESELLLVTSISGNTLTLNRGIEGTTAVAHLDGVSVSHVLTSGGLIGAIGTMILSDLSANLPATGTVGRLFFPSDTSNVYRESTAGWVTYQGLPVITSPPTLANWTQVNFGTGSTSGVATQFGPSIKIFAPAVSTGTARILDMAAPTTGYTITAIVDAQLFAVSFATAGIGWRDSLTDKQAHLHVVGNGTSPGYFDLEASYALTSSNLYTTHYATLSPFLTSPRILWLRIQDDGTNRSCFYSFDGSYFVLLDQRSRTYYDGSTTMNPDRVLLFTAPINASLGSTVILNSWHITQP